MPDFPPTFAGLDYAIHEGKLVEAQNILARAILIAVREDDRRDLDSGFEWYGSAYQLADALMGVLVSKEDIHAG